MCQTFECTIGKRPLIIETGKLAEQANGAVTVRYGDSVILTTACISSKPREQADFLPLTIDYEERLYAAGRIPGGFFRREGRPTEQATLAARLTDRPLRPLFPKDLHNDIQVVTSVLSVDQENDPDILSVIGASAALTISDIPFNGPISAVSVGCLNGSLALNPTLLEMSNSSLDLVVASTKESIVMIKGNAQEVPESLILEAIKFGHEANQEIIRLQEELRQACGKPKAEVKTVETNPELATSISSILEDKLIEALNQPNRQQRDQATASLKNEATKKLIETFPEAEIASAFEDILTASVRKQILDKKQHLDGRQTGEIRPLSAEVGFLPRTHGSALFARGQTQVMTITTLGPMSKEQPLDGLGLEETKRFMHHYNFPPFSTGEVKRIGSPGRREIGHGALVEQALIPMLPEEEDFPYAIRLVSEVLSSNGSTSMASVCGSSLSLMDAGVPVKAAVAGVAMGLVSGKNHDYVILTDIEGIEDACGDMDLKIAGTSRGITAIQLDIKLQGISYQILAQALDQARGARLEVLDKMQQVMDKSRPELSRYAPRMYRMTIDPSKIGAVIGPGGKTIRSIIDKTKVTMDVESNGTVLIGSPDEEAARKAIKLVEDLTQDVQVGNIYTGKVTRLLNFGAMMEIVPGKEGLVHISELADHRVAAVEDVVKVGEELMVKVIGIDSMGRINLSRRAVFENLSQMPGVKVRNSSAATRPAKGQHTTKPSPTHNHRGNRRPNYGK